MHPKRFALVGGILMLIAGILAFIPALSTHPLDLPVLKLGASYGLFLNIIPMNVLNKIALIVLGIVGILAASPESRNLPLSIKYSRFILYALGIAAILGIFPDTNTLFGYWPLFGGDIWLHGLVAIVGGYFGYMLTSKAEEHARLQPQHDRPAHGI